MKRIRQRPKHVNSLRDQAVSKLADAFLILKRAGCSELLPSIARDVYEYQNLKDKDVGIYWSETFKCSLQGWRTHAASIKVIKPSSIYYETSDDKAGHFISEYPAIEISFGLNLSDTSFFERLKKAFSIFINIVKGKIHKDTLIITDGEEVTKFKDLLKKIP